jgi:DNA-directed RNA polymerase specialized sigma24 family protein
MESLQQAPKVSVGRMPETNEEWNTFKGKLSNYILPLIASYNVSYWVNRQQDVVAEVTQQTLINVFLYMRRAAIGRASPIASFEAFCVTSTKHNLIDRWRKERRYLPASERTEELFAGMMDEEGSPEDQVVARMTYLARVKFFISILMNDIPTKQRQAVLIQLANTTGPDEYNFCPWRVALLEYDVCLDDYRRPLPSDPVERSRHASLLSHARKRLLRIGQEKVQRGEFSEAS